jgi:uncharacterized protein with HEPN domain
MPDKFGDVNRLQHALDAIKIIEGYVDGADFKSFSHHPMLRDACLRQLQVIGEACRNLSSELRNNHPEIPWRQIVGLRIIVIHEYFGVDEKVIWEVIQYDLPVFKGQIEAIISSLS